jgi:Tfp pilus assembly protein FimT
LELAGELLDYGCPPGISGDKMEVEVKRKWQPIQSKHNEKGLGLMEVIVGILATAIIGFIALHLVNLGLAMYKLSSGANEIAEKLERAKSLAVSQNKEISVLFDSKENKYGIDRNGNGKLESAEFEEMPEGVSFSQDGQIVFSRSGKPTKDSKEPSIVIRNTRDSKRVSVSSLGAVEIE